MIFPYCPNENDYTSILHIYMQRSKEQPKSSLANAFWHVKGASLHWKKASENAVQLCRSDYVYPQHRNQSSSWIV